ncbi:hypothetical protein NQ315_000606 [Exocentrus adspersus]|uniref:DDE Tnp4 domain-containing protein n=1 Tax=Exocentrus adspersus TaxID=1586481 RepID=A0AAV8VNR6_9CUCU|nr:hypothetical protein NQ315_000606 [Exocentrus adspersus]
MGISAQLRRFAYPNRWSDLEPMFGLSNKSLSDIGNYVMNIIYENNTHLLFHLGNLPWLDENRMRMYAAEAIVIRGGPLHNCWSFIDGTARAMCRPILNQENYYSGHKRFHALKYQSVVSPDGIIINLQGPYPGRRHDAAILRESNFHEQLEQHAVFPNGHSFVVYGDSAYGIRELLLYPFPNTEHVQDEERGAQQNFNYFMSVVRQSVEWGFAKIIRDFSFLDFKKNQKLLLQDLGVMYKTGALLTNCLCCYLCCLYGSESSQYFQVESPSLETYLIVMGNLARFTVSIHSTQSSVEIRNNDSTLDS